MFCGKSEELLRRLRRAEIAGQPLVLLKPALDTRYAAAQVVTHEGAGRTCLTIADPGEIAEAARKVVVVGIDEVQFFEIGIVDALESLVADGKRVVVCGLDLDSQRRPWPVVADLLARAEFIDKLQAVCVRCGGPATLSRRIDDDGPQVVLGASERYEARCRGCFSD